jgi:hypothetical protein
MQDPSVDPRLVGGAIWEDAAGLRVVVVATPHGFVLATWPPGRGMMTHVLPDGSWEFPDLHALAAALAAFSFVGHVEPHAAGVARSPLPEGR